MLTAVPDVEGEVKDYQEQLKQMLQDLAKEKEKDVEKPLPLMNQVRGTCCTAVTLSEVLSFRGSCLISSIKSVCTDYIHASAASF